MSNYDNLENKFKSPELNKKKSNNKALATMLAIALASSSLVGCGETDTMLAAVEEVTNPQVTNELSAELPQDVSETPNAIIAPKLENAKLANEFSDKLIDYSEYPDNLATGYAYSELEPTDQEWVTKLDNMSLEEYEKLPEQDQLKFAYYVFENNKPGFDARLKQAGIDAEYIEVPTERKQLVKRLEYVAMFLSSGLYTLDKDNKEDGLIYDDVMANKLKLLYIDKYNDDIVKSYFNSMIDVYKNQQSYNMNEYVITVLASMNTDITIFKVDGVFRGIIADLVFDGSSEEKQAAIRLVPFTTIQGDELLNSGFMSIVSRENGGVEITEE